MQRLQAPADLRDLREELQRLLDRHLEHVGDRLALEAHLERLAVVALALARLARDVDVGQEVHLDLDLPVALARLAAAALDVEREPAGLVAAHLRVGRQRVQLADVREQVGVRRRVRARRAADRALVDLDHLVEGLDALDPVVLARLHAHPLKLVGERLVDDLVHERRLAGARDAGDRDELADRELDVDALQVVLGGAEHGEPAVVLGRAAPAPRSRACPERNCPVIDFLLRCTFAAVPSATTWPPCSPAPGPMSTSQSALRIICSSCSTTMHGVAEVAQPLERADQLVVVALVQADRRLVEDVEHADELRADLRREPQPLRLAAGERRATRGRGSGSRRRRRRGTSAARGSP